jgi:hypothetical protein
MSLCDRTFVPLGGSNCTNEPVDKIPGANGKLGMRYMCDSLVVRARLGRNIPHLVRGLLFTRN